MNSHRPPQQPTHPAVAAATPRWRMALITALTWVQALSQVWLFILIGQSFSADFNLTAALIAVGLAAIAGGLSIWCTDETSALTRTELRRLVVEKLFSVGAVKVVADQGNLFNLATKSISSATRYRGGFLGPIVGAMTTPLIVLAALAIFVDWATALCMLICLLIIPFIVQGFRKSTKSVGGQYHRTQAKLTGRFLESIGALDMLVYNRAADRIAEGIAEDGEKNRKSVMKMLAVNQLLIFVVDAAFSLAVILVAAAVALARVHAGAIDEGQAVTLVLASLMVTGPVNVIGQFFYIGIGGRAAVSALSGFLRTPDHTSHVARGGEGIEVSHVTGGWPGTEPIIKDVSLYVAPGERVALVGKSGVGKSTLSAIIQGHLTPVEGSVHVGGEMAVVEQQTFLFHGTVRDNLLIAAPDVSDERLLAALEIAGLRDEITLDKPVGERGRLLSGGQAQRLSIARAWLTDRPVLLLDEPTSQVDLAGEAQILEALDTLARDRAVLMIAHRPDAILSANRVEELS